MYPTNKNIYQVVYIRFIYGIGYHIARTPPTPPPPMLHHLPQHDTSSSSSGGVMCGDVNPEAVLDNIIHKLTDINGAISGDVRDVTLSQRAETSVQHEMRRNGMCPTACDLQSVYQMKFDWSMLNHEERLAAVKEYVCMTFAAVSAIPAVQLDRLVEQVVELTHPNKPDHRRVQWNGFLITKVVGLKIKTVTKPFQVSFDRVANTAKADANNGSSDTAMGRKNVRRSGQGSGKPRPRSTTSGGGGLRKQLLREKAQLGTSLYAEYDGNWR